MWIDVLDENKNPREYKHFESAVAYIYAHRKRP